MADPESAEPRRRRCLRACSRGSSAIAASGTTTINPPRTLLCQRGDRLDLDQNVVAHQIGLKTGADWRLVAEIFGAYRVEPGVVGRVLEHDHDLENVAHF